jgi:tetratricopeptide (TPR) repeat protein
MDGRTGAVSDELIGAYARALLETGEPEKAFDRYLEALRQDESDYEWIRGIARSDPSRALPILEKRAEAEAGNATVVGALGDAYAKLGMTPDAIRQYERAIQLSDESGRWMAALAQVDEGRGIAMLRSALDANPSDDEMWGALGDAYRELGNLGAARKAYDRALELDPGDWEWNRRRDNIR